MIESESMKVQKRIREKIEDAKKMLIIVSRPIDFDCLAGGIILKHQLSKKGVNVELVAPVKIEDHFNFLPCIDEVEYRNTTGINMFEYDLIIAIDGGNTKQFSDVKKDQEFNFQGSENILNIDHHLGNSHFAKYEIWDKNASSTTEVLLDTLIDLTVISKDEATLLYAGLVGDTGNFKYNFSSKTLKYASLLIDKKADSALILNKYLYSNEALFFDIFIWLIEKTKYNKNLAYSYVGFDLKIALSHFNCDYNELKGGIRLYENYFSRSVNGINISFIVSKRATGFMVSMKGNGLNNKIPLPNLGRLLGGKGGGHFNSASCRLDIADSLRNVEKIVEKAVREEREKYYT